MKIAHPHNDLAIHLCYTSPLVEEVLCGGECGQTGQELITIIHRVHSLVTKILAAAANQSAICFPDHPIKGPRSATMVLSQNAPSSMEAFVLTTSTVPRPRIASAPAVVDPRFVESWYSLPFLFGSSIPRDIKGHFMIRNEKSVPGCYYLPVIILQSLSSAQMAIIICVAAAVTQRRCWGQ